MVWEYLLERGMATHSSILAWRIPWAEEPGGLQSMGSQSRLKLCHLQTVTVLLLFPFRFLLFIFYSDCCSYNFQNYLNESGESGHLYLVPDLRRNAFSFFSLSTMLVMGYFG